MLTLGDEDERVVGILHDVPEKTGWTLDNLRSEGFSDHVLEAIDAVTRRHGESYFDFVERTRTNDLGRRVKIADLNDKIARRGKAASCLTMFVNASTVNSNAQSAKLSNLPSPKNWR